MKNKVENKNLITVKVLKRLLFFKNVNIKARHIILFILFITTFKVNAQNFVISGGHDFSASLCASGTVLVWGSNSAGQMGGGATSNIPTPLLNSNLPARIKQVEAGSGSHAIALGCDGTVYSWGGNDKDQLGQGPAGGTGVGPVVGVGGVGVLSNTRYINAASNSSYAVLETGEVVAWGANDMGQLGNGDASVTSSDVPVHVLTGPGQRLGNVLSVQGNDYGGVALAEDGTIWTWGANTNMALGRLVDPNDPGSPTFSFYASQVVKKDGTPLTGIVQISGGDSHVLALDQNGQVWSWGGDWGPGQLGQSGGYDTFPYASLVAGGETGTPFLEGVTYVSAGQAHSLAVLSDGSVVSWGSNKAFGAGASGQEEVLNTGQLGLGLGPFTPNPATGVVPQGVEVPHYVLTGPGERLTGAKSVASGDSWSFIVTTNNQIYATGYNADGQLGLGDTDNRGYAETVTFPDECDVAQPCPEAELGNTRYKCEADEITLNAGSINANFTYTWFLDDVQVSQGKGLFSATYTATKPGKYKVVITSPAPNTCGEPCPPVEDTVTIMNTVPPPVPEATLCNGVIAPDYREVEDKRYEWYMAKEGGSALGTPTDNPVAFEVNEEDLVIDGQDTIIYVKDISGFKGLVGPKRDSFTNIIPGNPNTVDATLGTSKMVSLQFDALAEFILDSMTIGFISSGCTGAKTIKINVKDSDMNIVSSGSATVLCSVEEPLYVKIPLGIRVPKGEDYIIDAMGSDEGFAIAWFSDGPDNWLTDTNSLDGNDVIGNFYNNYFTGEPNNTYAQFASPGFFDWVVSSVDFYTCGRIPVKVKTGCTPCQKPTSFELNASAKSVCLGNGDASINLAVENISPALPGGEEYLYMWYKDDEPIDGALTSTLEVTSAPEMNSGTYTVRVGHFSLEEGSDCYLDSSVTLQFDDNITPGTIITDTILCEGSELNTQSLSPATGGSYQWQSSLTGQNDDWVSVPSATLENLATGPLTQSMFYRRMASDPNCGETVTNILEVQVQPLLTPTVDILTEPEFVCELDQDIPFEADSSGAGANGTFQWYLGNVLQTSTSATAALSDWSPPQDTIMVILTPGTDYACYGPADTAIHVVDVTGAQEPTATIVSEDQFCEGDEISFTAQVAPLSASDRLVWSVDGVEITEAENETVFTTSDLLPGQEVTLLFSSGSLCALAPEAPLATKSVTIFQKPVVEITSEKEDTLCAGDTNLLQGTATNITDASNLIYQWFRNDVLIPNVNEGEFNATEAGTYKVTIANGLPACEGTSQELQFVIQEIDVNAGPDVSIFKGEPAQILGEIFGDGVINWTPQDSMIVGDNVMQPIMYPKVTTQYMVTVETSAGCKDSDSMLVIVFMPIRVPNVFTPNNDGVNDTWEIDGLDSYPEVEVKIFNRWGNIVYKSTGYSVVQTWDGTAKNGEKVPVGTYYYVIDPKVEGVPVETGYVVVLE